MLKSKLGYHWSKLAPFGKDVKINLKNGLKFVVRAKTMDRSVVKEVWLQNIYNQHGINVSEGDTVVDIGAHIGVFSVYAADRSKTGQVYAFEPFIENFKRLDRHKTINSKTNLNIFNQGVSNIDGTQTLFLSPDNNTGGHSLHLKNESDNKVEIQTITLPKFCDDHQIEKIDFLKLDCEGAEFDILKSNEAILDRVDKMVLECHPYEDNTVQSMITLLEKNNFKVLREAEDKGDSTQMLYAKKKKTD